MLIGYHFSTLCENFGKVCFSDPGHEDVKYCTANVDNFAILSSATFASGGGGGGGAVKH